MTLLSATTQFAGIVIDCFVDTEKDNSTYVTLTSICKGLKISNQTTIDWLRRHNRKAEGIPVRVGLRNVPATAYPVAIVREFLDYRYGLNDPQVKILYSAIVQTALDRTAKEANLITVTSAQNEANAAEAANLYHKRVGQIFEKKELKALLPEGLVVGNTYVKAKVETSKGMR